MTKHVVVAAIAGLMVAAAVSAAEKPVRIERCKRTERRFRHSKQGQRWCGRGH